MTEEFEKTKVLIIGSGPAGYTAAIYTARADLKPLLYQGMQPGGQLTITTDVENFPGYPEGIGGFEMMEDLRKQAERFGADIRWGEITSIDLSERPFKVVADGTKTILADALIIATGASARWLGLETEEKYRGFGVSACATCDGFFYKGKEVAIIGGGDSAAEEATYLAKLCSKVYMIHRRTELRASKAMQNKVFGTPNIERLFGYVPVEITGEKNVEGLIIKNVDTGELLNLAISGLFVAIGHSPNSALFKGQLDMDESGYVITVPGTTQTSVKGVFAAGDVQDKVYRQATTAAGSGCMAAIEAERFLSSQH
ncbi:MAG TPA: thioredoxin-disulfide reductase [Bacteroidales bacterium]|nr:thioredoxin-disulfide reductase [Bacteroidales bacterium]